MKINIRKLHLGWSPEAEGASMLYHPITRDSWDHLPNIICIQILVLAFSFRGVKLRQQKIEAMKPFYQICTRTHETKKHQKKIFHNDNAVALECHCCWVLGSGADGQK